ncbi:uncharacterized protein [Antedon mediterranea]|uniref:uncharacterized protein n=1 Tax=Antedon mediterranea TaxID=105859 RepID=UPI003AF488C4
MGQFKAGLATKLLLNAKTAVPTIHVVRETSDDGGQVAKECTAQRSAFVKREKAGVIRELITGTEDEEEDEQELASVCDKPLMVSRGTQTRKQRKRVRRRKMSKAKVVAPKKAKPTYKEQSSDEDDEDFDESTEDDSDSDYRPEEDVSVSDGEDTEMEDDEMKGFNGDAHRQPKYIVFHNHLLMLLSICLSCFSSKVQVCCRNKGSMLIANIRCLCCHTNREWKSQPEARGTPMGNILLSGAILFSGSTPTQFLRALKSINVSAISKRTFFRHQQNFLHRVVRNNWFSKRDKHFAELQGKDISIGVDGRCDSMGHSAKYGSYTSVDLTENKILNVELVQSSDVKSSYHMELKGLQKTLDVFKDFKVNISTIVSDRHRQLQKYLRDNFPDIKHYFDCWHIAKSIKKKIQAISTKKSCNLLGNWQKSISNHYYWCVMSTHIDEKDIIEAKWKSVVRHVQNLHTGHPEPYTECAHPVMSPSDQRLTKWLTADTEACDALQKFVETKMLVKDIRNSSPHGQTSSVEGYHSLINHFAPKMFHFSYSGMKSRLFIAALHYNENSTREQMVNKAGEKQYVISFPKYKKGGYIVKKLLTECTYNYVDELFKSLLEVVMEPNLDAFTETIPPSLCAAFERPEKSAAVAQHTSRFKNQ